MILVTGAYGRLGSRVAAELARRGEVWAGIGRPDLDITDGAAVRAFITALRPDGVIHCAAYTSVDRAEDEPELCARVNARGAENVAAACAETGAEMLYVSTDYVFGGEGAAPYETDAEKAPLSVYGKSKSDGEDAALRLLSKCYVVRTSWMFGGGGGDFVETMLALAETKSAVRVVSDQTGSPTYAPDLAKLLCDMARSEKFGVYHATNEGCCSRAEFAREIMRLAGSACEVVPVCGSDYETRAARPKNSRLSKKSLDAAGFSRLPAWRDALSRHLAGHLPFGREINEKRTL